MPALSNEAHSWCGSEVFVSTRVVLLFVAVALFSVTTSEISLEFPGRTFVMLSFLYSNDFGLLSLCSLFAIRVLSLLVLLPLVRKQAHS
jgi:hypothetical protein